MKKKLINILLAVILLLSIPGTLILASDISNALYVMNIVVSNNGTAANYVSTNSTNISTPNLIAGSFLSSSANECAVLDAAGSDIPFMPGYSSNAWCFWISAIPAYSYLNYYLYTANTTGGLIAYFPATGGMSVDDDATLEPASDFEVGVDGWINTTDSNFAHVYLKRDSVGTSITDTSEVSGIIYYDEPLELVPSAFAAWTDVDISDYVPAHATGAVVHLTNPNAAAARNCGVRMNGSADALVGDLRYHAWTIVGIDSSDIFELYLQANDCHCYLVGFTGEDFTFKTNADDISLAAALAWTPIDISTEAPDAVGAIIVTLNTDGVNPREWGIRKNGSADNRHYDVALSGISYGIIGCDGSQVIQGYVETVNVDFYLVGYVTDNVTFETDGIDKSIVAVGAWTDIDCSGDTTDDTTHLIFEVADTVGGGSVYGFRRNGGTENLFIWEQLHPWVVVECDSDQVVEGYIGNVNVDFWLIGYIEGYIDAPYEDRVIADSVTSDEYDLAHSLNANAFDFSDYDTYTTVALSMGNGYIPVVLLDEEELAAPAASVTFSNINTLVSDWDTIAGVTSRHLVLMANAAVDGAVADRELFIRLNGDSGTNYNRQLLYGANAVAGASRGTGEAYARTGWIPGTTYANAFGGGAIIFPAAFLTTNHKSYLSFGGSVENTVGVYVGRWANTNAITTVLLYPDANNFVAGSTFWLGVVDERYLVEEDYLSGGDGLPDFNNIPQDGHDLCVIGYPRTDRAAVADSIYHTINGDGVAANYFNQHVVGFGGATSAASWNNRFTGNCTGDNAGANEFGAFLGYYSQYAEGTNDISYLTIGAYIESTLPTSELYVVSGRRNNVAAVTRLQYFPSVGVNFKQGSLFSLYRVPRYVIDRQELTAPAATITLGAGGTIPQGYEALQILIYGRGTAALISDDVNISYNNDVVAANYDTQFLAGAGAVVSAARNAATRIYAEIPAANEGANEFGGGILTIPNYAKADRHKHTTYIGGRNENIVVIRSCRWEDTAPITEIDLTLGGGNWDAGTIVELIGFFPQDVHVITVDGDLYGISDGNNLSVTDTNLDWYFGLKYALPYINSANVTVSGVPVSAWAWEYDTTFYDSIGANDATPSFRTASSDVDVEATAVSFQPVEEAKAPSYTMDTTTATWLTAANVVGNFTTTPTPTYPGHEIIEDVSAATGTPAQLPFTVLFGFVALTVSLSISAILRDYGSRSLFVKTLVIGVMMGIGEALQVVDFWMLLFFIVIAITIMTASKQGDVV